MEKHVLKLDIFLWKTINFTGVLHKMKILGIDEKLLIWTNRFLNERSLLIKTKNTKNEGFTPKHGVPQENPFSPVLLIIYVNYISQLKKYKQQAL